MSYVTHESFIEWTETRFTDNQSKIQTNLSDNMGKVSVHVRAYSYVCIHVCVCVCVCTYVYMYTYVHTHTHNIWIYNRSYCHTQTDTRPHAGTHTHTHRHTHAHAHAWTQARARARTHTHTHVFKINKTGFFEYSSAVLQHTTFDWFCVHHSIRNSPSLISHVLQHTASHCTTLQHAVTHCNTLQHTATQTQDLFLQVLVLVSCNTLHHNVTHCCTHTRLVSPSLSSGVLDTLQNTAPNKNTL